MTIQHPSFSYSKHTPAHDQQELIRAKSMEKLGDSIWALNKYRILRNKIEIATWLSRVIEIQNDIVHIFVPSNHMKKPKAIC